MKPVGQWLVMPAWLLLSLVQAQDEPFAVTMTLFEPVSVTVSDSLLVTAVTSDQDQSAGARLQLRGRPGTMATITIVGDTFSKATMKSHRQGGAAFIDPAVRDQDLNLHSDAGHKHRSSGQQISKPVHHSGTIPDTTAVAPGSGSSRRTAHSLLALDGLSKNGHATFSEQGNIDNIRIRAHPVSAAQTNHSVIVGEATLRIVF